MFDGLGDAIVALFRVMQIALAITIPLAIWKLIDIGIWIFNR